MFETLTLFIGALLDGIVGANVVVPGVPFYLAAGYQLHQHMISATVAVLLGGWLGDQISYQIGITFGPKASRALVRWRPSLRRTFARARLLMHRRGNVLMITARLLGPVAWVTPFLAGTMKVNRLKFTVYSTLGLLMGVGQFILLGYLLAAGMEQWIAQNSVAILLKEHQLLLVSLAMCLLYITLAMKFNWTYKWFKLAALTLVCLLGSNYLHFFESSDDHHRYPTTSSEHTHSSVFEQLTQPGATTFQSFQLNPAMFKAYPGRAHIYDAQAINVIYVGKDPRQLMTQLGWIENRTFSRNDIDPITYIQLLRQKLPPVSDLFWNGEAQHLAFQEAGSLLKRSHIRWWPAQNSRHNTLWLGAISYDDGLKIAHYTGILTVLHRIDPNVDHQRDRLAQQVQKLNLPIDISTIATRAQHLDQHHDYYTDGHLLVLDSESQLTPGSLQVSALSKRPERP